MSQYGEGDYCPVWQDRWVTARKAHVCSACGETIERGNRYHTTFSVFDGIANQVKRCERCQTIFAHLSSLMTDPEEFCDERLACGHEYVERWSEEPPPEIAALAFWLPGEPLP